MSRGGSRSGAGRTAINGKELKIKLSNEIVEQLDMFFIGKTVQERIRECLEFGINTKEKEEYTMEDNKFNVVDLFSGAGGLSRGFMDAGFNVVLGIDAD